MPRVTRDITIDAPVETVWEHVADRDRRAEWLGGDLDVDLEQGHRGTFVTPDGDLPVRVDEVVAHRTLRFTWGHGTGSSVTIELTPEGGASRVRVTETVDADHLSEEAGAEQGRPDPKAMPATPLAPTPPAPPATSPPTTAAPTTAATAAAATAPSTAAIRSAAPTTGTRSSDPAAGAGAAPTTGARSSDPATEARAAPPPSAARASQAQGEVLTLRRPTNWASTSAWERAAA